MWGSEGLDLAFAGLGDALEVTEESFAGVMHNAPK